MDPATYIQQNPSVITNYIAANPQILNDYVTANPQVIIDFLATNGPQLGTFLQANPQVVTGILTEVTKNVPNPFQNSLVSFGGYTLTVELAILVALPLVFCAVLFFLKNTFSYAMILIWVVIGAIMGGVAFGLSKVPDTYRPFAKLAADYLGSIVVAIFALLSILVIAFGIGAGAIGSAIPNPLNPATLVPK